MSHVVGSLCDLHRNLKVEAPKHGLACNGLHGIVCCKQ
jgi:hypothetical protein